MSPSSHKPLCIVPARGGSKRLPRKNVALLGGKPLLAWTIDAALEANIFDAVWVSSEDHDILQTAEKWGGTPLPRPAELADDRATEVQVCLHVIGELATTHPAYSALYVLVPTSPFRRSETIRKAWHTFLESGADALFSVVPQEHPPQWGIVDIDGWLHPWRPEEYELPRQDLTQIYRHDGGHAIVRMSSFLQERVLLGSRTMPFSVPIEETVDIDDPMDLAWAEFLLQRGMVV